MNPIKYLYVYILKCADNTYYTGVTNNPEKRLLQHQHGINRDCYTYSRRPLELVYCERFNDYNLAITWEKKIKDWARKKKEALIGGKFHLLAKLSECQNETHYKNKSQRSRRVLESEGYVPAKGQNVEVVSTSSITAGFGSRSHQYATLSGVEE